MPETVVPSYRYYVADLLTGAIVMEIPFGQVSWERKITTAGAFSGSIAADENQNHFDLYNTTVPGRYALYVMRDSQCVWGGIIWGRDYNISDKLLNVSALEFTSYFFHRVYWKTVTIGGGTTVKALIETLVSDVTTDQLNTDEYTGYAASDVHHVVAQYSVTSSVATLTTQEPHGFVAGSVVRISGVDALIDGFLEALMLLLHIHLKSLQLLATPVDLYQ